MKLKSIGAIMLLGLTVGLTACSDPDDEITSLVLDRNFSPVDLEARVQQRTNIRLNWTLSSGATSYTIEQYDNDSLDFEGVEPTKTYTVTPAEVPYTITGLEGETGYSFRVKASDSIPSRDSKWSVVYAKTSAEQILNDVTDANLTARTVTISWPAGQEAQNIIVRDASGTEVVNHALTADEIAAGSVTLSGLTPETEYTATMYRANGKERGHQKFTTPIELLDGDVLVSAGDDLESKFAEVPEGGRLIVNDGTYVINGDGVAGPLTIDKSVTIKGLHASNRPVIKGRFVIAGGTDIAFDQIIIRGDSTSGDQVFNVTGASTYNSLSVTNCDITGDSKGTKGLIYINVAAKFGTITFDNNIIHDVACSGGDFIDSRKGAFDALNFTNNTVYNSCADRDFIRFDDTSKNFSGVKPVITVDHNTLVDVDKDSGADRRLFYVRFKGNTITFTNNIVSGFQGKRGFSEQKNTDASPTLSGNFYYNTVNLLKAGETANANIKWYDTTGTELTASPFADAAKFDFTVTNDDVKYAGAGDPRWIPAQ